MSKLLIIGASGYVGGRLVRACRELGHDVHALVREAAPWLTVEQTVCDLTHENAPEALASACLGIDAVIHLAGENEIFAARAPAAALASTIVATERVSEACSSAGVKRLVYMSSVHVYGERMVPHATLSEDMRPEPRSAYAISRLASEHVAASLAKDAYELVILRLTNSVGAPAHPSIDRWTLVANDLCRQGSVNGWLELRSSGTQWRDFVSLGTVCSVIAKVAGGEQRAVAPGTYNLGSGRSIRVRDLAAMIQDAFEQHTGRRPELRAPEPEQDPPGPYDVSIEGLSRYGLELGEGVEVAVAETVRFCLDHREEL